VLVLTTLVLALLAAPPAERPSLALPGFGCVQIDSSGCDFFSDYFARQTELKGVHVTTRRDIEALLGFERQRQLLGCSQDSSSCTAELAGALGVEGVITGNIARTSAGYAANIKIVSAVNGKALGVHSVRVANDEALLDWFGSLAAVVAAEIAPGGAPQALQVQQRRGGVVRPWTYALLGVALASAAAGGIFGGLSWRAAGQAAAGVDYAGSLSTAQRFAMAADVCFGLAGAGLIAGIVAWAVGPRTVSAAVLWAPGDASSFLVVAGRF
jgi:hypothetical protein